MEKIIKRAVRTGEKIEIIYLSKDHRLSQRVIKIVAITDQTVKAYCYSRRKWRTFMLENILSAVPVRDGIGA